MIFMIKKRKRLYNVVRELFRSQLCCYDIIADGPHGGMLGAI